MSSLPLDSAPTFRSYAARSLKPHTVAGVELKFSPCRLEVIQAFQPIIAQVWKACDVLMRNEFKDRGRKEQNLVSADGSQMQETINEPVSKEVAQLRQDNRDRAINTLTGLLKDKTVSECAGAMIRDSLRNDKNGLKDFCEGLELPDDPSKFFGAIPLDVAPSLLAGLWEANKGAFGPLGDRVATIVRLATLKIENLSALALEPKQPPTPPAPASPTPESPTTDQSTSTTSSSNSKTT